MNDPETATNMESAEIRIRGKTMQVPAVNICDRNVIATGKFLKLAAVRDEDLVEGETVSDPALFVSRLKASGLKADVFSFAQRPPATTPKHNYHFEWDNWAAITTNDYNAWWEKRLPQESRKNVRRAAKRGVVVRETGFDDTLVQGIQAIYSETPVRQGRRFWHYGKDFATVKMENATYLSRSVFVGAYFGEVLIGFIKYIQVDGVAMLIQILTKNEHHDKRPMNALLAHTVELCCRKRLSFLVYGQYVYGTKQNSSLTEFKRRNGFEEVRFPRYYIPLNLKGRLAVGSGLHLGVRNIIPRPINDLLLKARDYYCRAVYQPANAAGQDS